MRYLKYFESNITGEIKEILRSCKDILIEIEDNGGKVNIDYESMMIIIEIPSIKLNSYGLEFHHLFSYLKEEGYNLSSDLSYVTNDRWEADKACPECGGHNIHNSEVNGDYISRCISCDYSGYEKEFLEFRHRVSESDIRYFIKKKYLVDTMVLFFKKV